MKTSRVQMNERLKLIVTSQCIHIPNDIGLDTVRSTDEKMATLDIPSLPSSDLSHMLRFVMTPTTSSHRVWPVRASVSSLEEAEHSPEPKFPRFGANDTPSFAESNSHFGFNFTNSEIECVTNHNNATRASDAECSLVSDRSETSSERNIPTTVMDKVEDTSKKHRRAELPTILLSNGVGKPDSYIKFLNEPIPLDSVQYEVNLDTYRKAETTETTYSVLNSELDAIQRMEDEPSPAPVQHSLDQCVPVQSTTVQQCYEVVTDDQSGLVEDVAAYQSVVDTPTYTELQTRQVSTISELDMSTISEAEVSGHSVHTEIQPDNHLSQPDTEPEQERVEELRVNMIKDLEANLLSASEESKMNLVLKNELKHKIQLKRLQEGKEMLQVSFENRPIGEPSEEEKKKAHTRKMKNRESAVRSRKRRQDLMEKYEKEVKDLERENKKLAREIRALKEENSQIAKLQCECSCLTEIPSEDAEQEAVPGPSHTDGLPNQQSLREAIASLLAAEGKT